MESLNHVKQLLAQAEKDIQKVYNRNNRLAGKRARKALKKIEMMMVPMREEILAKMKTIPVKKKVK